MTETHKVFLSFYNEDIEYKEKFEKLFSNCIVSKSIQEGEIPDGICTDETMRRIRDSLADSTVTVVLIGNNTYKRKYVDWEIYSSLRNTEYSSRSGLLGILLPTRSDFNTNHYCASTIPPRLQDNVVTKYAHLYNWTYDHNQIVNMIDYAFSLRKTGKVDLSRERFGKNH